MAGHSLQHLIVVRRQIELLVQNIQIHGIEIFFLRWGRYSFDSHDKNNKIHNEINKTDFKYFYVYN